MANSISSDITISSAISVLQNMLAPLSQFTMDITSDVVGRQASVKVPIVGTDDVARPYDSTKGYTADADTDLDTVTVSISEHIKPFHLNDNDLNKSPLSLQNYAMQNANEFGRYLMKLLYSKVTTATGGTPPPIPAGNQITADADAVSVANIKSAHAILDSAGANMNRHMILGASASNNLLPSTIETFGNSVVESGRFNQLFGMSTSTSNAHGALASGDVHTICAPSDAIVIVNRLPEVSGKATLEEFTSFTIDGLGLQCAYRRFYDASKGIHYGAFTTMFGCEVAKGSQIAIIKES